MSDVGCRVNYRGLWAFLGSSAGRRSSYPEIYSDSPLTIPHIPSTDGDNLLRNLPCIILQTSPILNKLITCYTFTNEPHLLNSSKLSPQWQLSNPIM